MADKRLELADIFLEDPNIFDVRTVTKEELLHIMKPVTGFRVVKEFEDDHVACFEVEMTVDGKTYKYDFMWAGQQCNRLFYQSEISPVIRNTMLMSFLADKMTEDQ